MYTITHFTKSGAKVQKIIEICKKKVKKYIRRKCLLIVGVRGESFAGLNPALKKKERNALTEVARTGQR